jgi:hypothetical protein
MPCFAVNPSCSRDDAWWMEWFDLQEQPVADHLAQFSSLGSGFRAEFRFAEAVVLIWAWPEGRQLLQDAARFGITVVSGGAADMPTAYADFNGALHRIRINATYRAISTWALADLLVHELQHVHDALVGAHREPTQAGCIAEEVSAYAAEARFARWIGAAMGSLPAPDVVAKTLSAEDSNVYAAILAPVNAPDLAAYVTRVVRDDCNRWPGNRTA